MIPITTLGENSEAVYYRVITPAYAGTPLSGMGAARRGGRFNRPGQEALYLSADAVSALAEYKQDNPWLPPGTICTYFIHGLRVADFSSGFDAEKWPPLWSDYAVDWRAEWFGKAIEPPTWYMADDVVAAGLDGILFPSQARLGGTNLVVYRSSARALGEIRVYDPHHALQQIGVRPAK